MRIKYTNGYEAEYDGDGKWLMIDMDDNEMVLCVGYLSFMEKHFTLTRVAK